MGTAYAFFSCTASKKELDREFAGIRDALGIPSALELLLMNVEEKKYPDAALMTFVSQARALGMSYLLEATYPPLPNSAVCDELSTLLNAVYEGSGLFDKESQLEIVYKSESSGHYFVRE